MTDSIEVHGFAYVERFIVSQFPLMLDRGHGGETHGAN